MTRTTRAAARTRELTEEATSTPLPATPERERVPLGEISENVRAEPAMVTITVNDSIKAGKKKGKQGKGVGKGNKKGAALPQEQDVVILEDDNQGSASSAVEETRTSLGEDTSEGMRKLSIYCESCLLTVGSIQRRTNATCQLER